MNTKNTYPPTYTSVSPTTSMSTRARRALGSVELENRAPIRCVAPALEFIAIVVVPRSAIALIERVRRTIERAREEGPRARAIAIAFDERRDGGRRDGRGERGARSSRAAIPAPTRVLERGGSAAHGGEDRGKGAEG